MSNGTAIRYIAYTTTVVVFTSFNAFAGGKPPSALGPSVPVVEPSGGYEGSIVVEPANGPGGAPVKVSGKGFPADTSLDLVWNTSVGKWNVEDAEYHGREYQPVAYRIDRVKTNSEGGFTAGFEVPEDFGFWHDITVQTSDRRLTQAAFYVDMTVDLVEISGPVGSQITFDISGIGRQQLQNSWLLLYDNKFTGWISSVTTGGAASFSIPATGAPGIHTIEVLHGDFTFPYRNMQQSPEPNRPRFSLEYRITEGDAVLPPPPEKQEMTVVRSLPAESKLKTLPRYSIVGEPITVSGGNFTPGSKVDLNWTSVTGNRVSGSGWDESSRIIASAIAAADGTVEFSFDTPDDLGGAHRIWTESNGQQAEGAHWISPSAAALSQDFGIAGTPFTINLKGVGWTETANIYTIVYDNAYIGYACGFNSQGDVEIFLKATGEPGWHFIDLYPAIYKGKERRPNNFRLPQLTYADDHPGEDLPAFHFAFKVAPSDFAGQ